MLGRGRELPSSASGDRPPNGQRREGRSTGRDRGRSSGPHRVRGRTIPGSEWGRRGPPGPGREQDCRRGARELHPRTGVRCGGSMGGDCLSAPDLTRPAREGSRRAATAHLSPARPEGRIVDQAPRAGDPGAEGLEQVLVRIRNRGTRPTAEVGGDGGPHDPGHRFPERADRLWNLPKADISMDVSLNRICNDGDGGGVVEVSGSDPRKSATPSRDPTGRQASGDCQARGRAPRPCSSLRDVERDVQGFQDRPS